MQLLRTSKAILFLRDLDFAFFEEAELRFLKNSFRARRLLTTSYFSNDMEWHSTYNEEFEYEAISINDTCLAAQIKAIKVGYRT